MVSTESAMAGVKKAGAADADIQAADYGVIAGRQANLDSLNMAFEKALEKSGVPWGESGQENHRRHRDAGRQYGDIRTPLRVH